LTSPGSLEELITPRPVMMPSPEVFDADLAEIERTIRRTVPAEIRKRIGVSRSLAVYGAFCYDFISVSAFWSLSCIEMALWEKFAELHPSKAATHKRRRSGHSQNGQAIRSSCPTLPLLMRWSSSETRSLIRRNAARCGTRRWPSQFFKGPWMSSTTCGRWKLHEWRCGTATKTVKYV
jgi:hypothetical protein